MIRLTFFSLTILAVAGYGHAQSWTSFQNGGKLESKMSGLPTSWNNESNIQWQTPIVGYGQSTPVLYRDRIYVTSVAGANKETVNVEAFKIADGTRIWHYQRENTTQEKNTVMVSRSAASPVSDRNGVIAFYEGGNLIALSHDGSLRWERDLVEDYGPLKARHGLASSLEQDDKHVFVWAQRMESPYVIAISKSDGKTVWKQDTMDGTSWGSPRLIQFEDENHLVLSASGSIIGLNPTTGKRLWTLSEISGNSSSTPMPIKSGEFLIGSMGSRNGDDNAPSSGVVEITKSNNAYQAVWKWRSKDAKCSFGSPIACHERAYFVNRSGIVHCYRLESGEEIFKGRLPSGQIWATPLATRDSIYFFGKDGVTAIVKPSDSLEVAAKNELWKIESEKSKENDPAARFSGAVLYAAIVADSKLIMRRGDRLYAVATKGHTENE